ncbi:alpha-1,3-arabinosyltransferase XAT2-like [Salvia miltiorrhiza]|uniref:alpha-1,3-arabinosyltransferase XAT2-like n=1 Tax=Salvia miltiorrhiza TaxID=226208 RepID=UPI0025AB6913|nr:alpha-1,3-arabinosyltransferase XAT2-like [Salvia miltiorrhiza]
MRKVRNLKITNQNPNTTPPCSRRFTAPAVVFSAKGYTGNPFHDFTDVLIPLYLTSQPFNTTVIFLVTNINSWWISKYKPILNMLSKYDLIDLDNQDDVLCFPRIIVGLKSHKELGIDQSMPPNYSTADFTKFLRKTYSLERGRLVGGCKDKRRRPRLLIVSRQKTRRLRNEYEVAELARSVGFDVRVREMGWHVSLVAKFVNSFDVMVGVHGAGITNMVFLPENAVVIQIVPIGLEGPSRTYFEIPSKDMKLRHLEYKVEVRESSLVEKYGIGNQVFNRQALYNKGWNEFRSVYLDNQDVSIDLFRFKRALLEAMDLVCS